MYTEETIDQKIISCERRVNGEQRPAVGVLQLTLRQHHKLALALLSLSCCCDKTGVLGTVDYVTPDGRTILFRTADVEKGRLVFQLGTANATTALQAAQKVLQ